MLRPSGACPNHLVKVQPTNMVASASELEKSTNQPLEQVCPVSALSHGTITQNVFCDKVIVLTTLCLASTTTMPLLKCSCRGWITVQALRDDASWKGGVANTTIVASEPI